MWNKLNRKFFVFASSFSQSCGKWNENEFSLSVIMLLDGLSVGNRFLGVFELGGVHRLCGDVVVYCVPHGILMLECFSHISFCFIISLSSVFGEVILFWMNFLDGHLRHWTSWRHQGRLATTQNSIFSSNKWIAFRNLIQIPIRSSTTSGVSRIATTIRDRFEFHFRLFSFSKL